MIETSNEFKAEDVGDKQVVSIEKECSSDAEERNKHCHNVLGLLWNSQSDMLTFEFSEIIAKAETKRVLTKRVILRTVARVMFQQLCKDKLQWDDELDQSLQDKWRTFLTNLKQVQEICVDRCYAKEFDHQTASSIQLHGFGNASNEAYGASTFVTIESGSETHCQLVTSKTRVAPMKIQTIPRLELLACLITARSMDQVLTQVRTRFWIPKSRQYNNSKEGYCEMQRVYEIGRQIMRRSIFRSIASVSIIRRFCVQQNWLRLCWSTLR